MERLVYSPKVYAFVRTDKHPYGFDISDWIVRGNVHRRVNAVSSATIELRNPNQLWTQPGDPFFHPMDPITIFLTRLRGLPIQTFTGYLDSTPYLQLFPGTVTLEASCTLKRLQHTYWDPALPWTMQFLRQHGWIVDQQNGTMFSQTSVKGNTTVNDLNDGSIGNLLFYTLKEIGRWDPTSVYVERLPTGIIDKSKAMFQRVEDQNGDIADEIVNLFKLIGTEPQGEGGGTYADGGASAGSSKDKWSVAQLVQLAWSKGLRGQAAAIAGAVAMAESTGNQGATNNNTDGSVDRGLWQINSVHSQYDGSKLLSDASYNADAMYDISSGGTNWQPWVTFQRGMHQQYMSTATNAVSDIVGGKTFTHETAASSSGTKSGKVLHLGDSLGVGMAPYLKSALGSAYIVTSNVQTGRTAQQGWDVLKGMSSIPDRVVIQLGTNDFDKDTFKTYAQKIMTKLGNSRTVLWSNVYRAAPYRNIGINTVLADLAADYSNLSILDWDAAVKAKKVTIGGDGLHSDAAGYRYWGSQVAKVVKGASSDITVVSGTTTVGTGTNGAAPAAIDAKKNKLRDAIVAAAKDTLSTKTGYDRYDQNGSLSDNPTPPPGERTDCSQWVRAIYLKCGAPDPGANSSAQAGNGKRTTNPKPGDLVLDAPNGGDHVELYVGNGQTIGHGSGKIDYWTVQGMKDYFGDVIFVTFDFLGDDATVGASTDDQTVAQSGGSAFATYLNFPSLAQTAEAIGLRGQKSLMNDVPLLPFIQQLSEASLRSFQSMPNGNFFGFFPDYFGGFDHRTPYWMIDDIEILDGKINLTDDYLVTHSFVVGDIVPDQTINFVDRLQSGGVMDIESAFKSGFIAGQDFDRDYILKFLERYGVRPKTEEMPLIRSPYFELFVAYQRFMQYWAKQFATDFTFTFMPELYPGGIVGFADHGIQCYVEEVVHEFDYEDGFSTTAVLSAPAAMKNITTPVSQGMVRGFDFEDTSTAPVASGSTSRQATTTHK